MDVAIVTGASTGLGAAISRKLLELGFRVYGLGGNYAQMPFNNVDFRPVPCDLKDPAQVERSVKEILREEGGVYVLVNNAKMMPRQDWHEVTGPEMQSCLAVNLLCPLVLVRAVLESLCRLQGFIINIGSSDPESARGGPIGAATAGGLRWMGESLFQELREYGVKVTNIAPMPNRWHPAEPGKDHGRPQSVIDPNMVAQAVSDVLSNRLGNIVTDIVIRPQRLKEQGLVPVREIPYPEPQPIPYTTPRQEIESEERRLTQQDDEEEGSMPDMSGEDLDTDVDADDEGEELPETVGGDESPRREAVASESTDEPGEGQRDKKRRRRRRRRKNRDRDNRPADGTVAPAGENSADAEGDDEEGDEGEETDTPAPEAEAPATKPAPEAEKAPAAREERAPREERREPRAERTEIRDREPRGERPERRTEPRGDRPSREDRERRREERREERRHEERRGDRPERESRESREERFERRRDDRPARDERPAPVERPVSDAAPAAPEATPETPTAAAKPAEAPKPAARTAADALKAYQSAVPAKETGVAELARRRGRKGLPASLKGASAPAMEAPARAKNPLEALAKLPGRTVVTQFTPMPGELEPVSDKPPVAAAAFKPFKPAAAPAAPEAEAVEATPAPIEAPVTPEPVVEPVAEPAAEVTSVAPVAPEAPAPVVEATPAVETPTAAKPTKKAAKKAAKKATKRAAAPAEAPTEAAPAAKKAAKKAAAKKATTKKAPAKKAAKKSGEAAPATGETPAS